MKPYPFVGEDNRYHYVYKIINLSNGKFYIGKKTSDIELDLSYTGSSDHLNASIRKYGRDKFVLGAIAYFDSDTEAYDYEAKIITEDMVRSESCYNRQGGGRGFASGKMSIGRKLLDEGIHPFQRMVLEGRHPTQNQYGEKNISHIMSVNGTHYMFTVKPWSAPSGKFPAKCVWYHAKEFQSGEMTRIYFRKKYGIYASRHAYGKVMYDYKQYDFDSCDDYQKFRKRFEEKYYDKIREDHREFK